MKSQLNNNGKKEASINPSKVIKKRQLINPVKRVFSGCHNPQHSCNIHVGGFVAVNIFM